MHISRQILWGAAFAGVSLAALPAQAESTGDLAITTSWVDTGTWNKLFSEEPGLEWDASEDLSNGFFIGTSGRIGFDDADGLGSEIDATVGVVLPAGGPATLTLSAARWQYGSDDGFRSGDWVGEADFALAGVTASAIVIRGDADDDDENPDAEILRLGYEHEFGRAALGGSVAYVVSHNRETNETLSEFRPALTFGYTLSEHAYAGLSVVKDEEGGITSAFSIGWRL